MSEIWQSAMADNGAYVLSAFAIILGSLVAYALWLQGRLASARARREMGPLDPPELR